MRAFIALVGRVPPSVGLSPLQCIVCVYTCDARAHTAAGVRCPPSLTLARWCGGERDLTSVSSGERDGHRPRERFVRRARRPPTSRAIHPRAPPPAACPARNLSSQVHAHRENCAQGL